MQSYELGFYEVEIKNTQEIIGGMVNRGEVVLVHYNYVKKATESTFLKLVE